MMATRRNVLLSGLPVLGGFGLGLRHAFGQGAALQTTKIANASGTLNLTVQQLVRQRGYFEEFGLSPDIINVADGSKIVSGLLGGDIESSMMSGLGQIFPAIAKNAPIKIIAGAALLPSLALFTSKPDIKTLKDLEGRVIGVGSLGALLHQLCVALLRKNNVDVSKVRFVNIGASADVFRAVIVGTVDAGPGEVAALDNPSAYSIRPIEGGNMSITLPEYTYQGAWTTDDVIAKKRDILVRSLAAHAKLYRFLHSPDSREAFIKARLAALPTSNVDEGTAQWNYVQRYKPYAVDLVLDENRIGYLQQVNLETKVQSTVLPFDKCADMSIARDALKLLK